MSPRGPEGKSDLIAEWVRTWHLPLKRFLKRKRFGSSAEIDDIAQETYLRLLRYDRFGVVDNPRAYLFTVASNVAIEWSARASRRQPHREEWLADLVSAERPDHEFERESADAELIQAINRLPPRQREILRLHFEDGLNHEAIARQLGLTRRTVKRDICAAYAALRTALPDYRADGTSTEAQSLEGKD